MDLNIKNISKFQKLGRGHFFEFYATDAELNHILKNRLPREFEPYSLIGITCLDTNKFLHVRSGIENFLTLRESGYTRFYLLSEKLSKEIIYPEDIVNGIENGNAQKYYAYNGLIDLIHGVLAKNGSCDASAINLVDKYSVIDNPENFYENRFYKKIYKSLEKSIMPLLLFKSKHVWLDGRIFVSKRNNITNGFTLCIEEGSIKVDFEVVK